MGIGGRGRDSIFPKLIVSLGLGVVLPSLSLKTVRTEVSEPELELSPSLSESPTQLACVLVVAWSPLASDAPSFDASSVNSPLCWSSSRFAT